MKKFILLATVLLSINLLMAQGCLPEGITFSTQTEIDNFQTNYPGCTHILGNVTISNAINYTIENLNGLAALQSVAGDFIITDNYGLLNLNGLNNLEHVGGNLSISYNYFITDLQGLASLDTVAGSL